jgi:hypothetical protein
MMRCILNGVVISNSSFPLYDKHASLEFSGYHRFVASPMSMLYVPKKSQPYSTYETSFRIHNNYANSITIQTQ